MPRASPEFERRPEDIRFGVLDHLLGYALRRAQVAIARDFDAAMAGSGISPPLFAALTLIVENPGLSQSRLSQVMGLARSRIVALVDVLEGEGLVTRRAVPGDRRRNGVLPSAAGHRRHAALAARVLAHDARSSARLNPQERNKLRQLLERLG